MWSSSSSSQQPALLLPGFKSKEDRGDTAAPDALCGKETSGVLRLSCAGPASYNTTSLCVTQPSSF